VDSKDQWGRFARDADEFFISYIMVVCDSSFLFSTHFLIGHSVELYLKAVYIKQTGDVAGASGHNVRELFEACQKGKPPFMPSFSFKGTFGELHSLSQKKFNGIILTKEEDEKAVHFLEHQEFYLIADNLMNLKYFSSLWKGKGKENKGKNIASMRPDIFWINFVKEVKAYLGYDASIIRYCLDGFGCKLSQNAKAWLSEIYK
jgi:hypothetical protein